MTSRFEVIEGCIGRGKPENMRWFTVILKKSSITNGMVEIYDCRIISKKMAALFFQNLISPKRASTSLASSLSFGLGWFWKNNPRRSKLDILSHSFKFEIDNDRNTSVSLFFFPSLPLITYVSKYHSVTNIAPESEAENKQVPRLSLLLTSKSQCK